MHNMFPRPSAEARRRGLTATAAAACALAALAVPAIVGAQSSEPPPPYALPTPTPEPSRPPATGGPGPPRLGEAAVLERVRGRVTFRLPGATRSRTLTRPAQVPMGTLVDARRGRVRVVVRRSREGTRTWRAVFHDGRFTVEQERSAPYLTTLYLAGGSFSRCEQAGVARAARASTARKRKRKRVRRLWGSGRGRYRTSGRYSAATVRGTTWLVEDRCDGTLTRVARGVVDVEEFPPPEPAPTPAPSPAPDGQGGDGAEGQPAPAFAPPPERRRGKRVRVRRGESYVAKAK